MVHDSVKQKSRVVMQNISKFDIATVKLSSD